MKKKIIIPLLAVAIVGIGAFGISQVHAQSNGSPASGLVSAIAQKFNLDQNQLQLFVASYRQQNRQVRLQTRLDRLVSQGKITQAQKQAILTEIASLKTKYNLNSLGTMTPQEKRQAFQNAHSEFKTWAQSQGINLPLFGRGFKRFNRIGW